jgi:hypothetical protein
MYRTLDLGLSHKVWQTITLIEATARARRPAAGPVH